MRRRSAQEEERERQVRERERERESMSVSFARTLSGRSVPRVGTERPRRPNWRKVKGFLMDIDGTMAETDPLHEIAIREMFRRAGASADVVVDHRFIRENISGVDNADIVEKVSKTRSEISHDRAVDRRPKAGTRPAPIPLASFASDPFTRCQCP